MHQYWDEYNPWRDRLIYLPDLKEVSACLSSKYPGKYYNLWEVGHNLRVDAYLIPQPSGFHEIGIRYGKEGWEYYSPLVNKHISSLLLHKYSKPLESK